MTKKAGKDSLRKQVKDQVLNQLEVKVHVGIQAYNQVITQILRPVCASVWDNEKVHVRNHIQEQIR